MISVDTVYQKVLAVANKEQRGYLTPQEFKLLASKAQLEIYNSYFDNVRTAFHKQKNSQGVAFDEIEMHQEKLHPFQKETNETVAANSFEVTLPSDLYYINSVYSGTTTFNKVAELTKRELLSIENHPLLAPTITRPVYVRQDGTNSKIRIYPTPTVITVFNIDYYKIPSTPEWPYVVVNGSALYDSTSSNLQNFELHNSEEENLVNTILHLAGILVQNEELQQAAILKGQLSNQEKNN